MSDSQGDGTAGVEAQPPPDRTAVEGLKEKLSAVSVGSLGLPGGIASGASVYVKALVLVLTGLAVVVGGGFALLTSGVLTWLVESAAVVVGVLTGVLFVIVVLVVVGSIAAIFVGTRRVIVSYLVMGVLVIATQTGLFQYAVSAFFSGLGAALLPLIGFFGGIALIVILMKPMWLSSFLRAR